MKHNYINSRNNHNGNHATAARNMTCIHLLSYIAKIFSTFIETLNINIATLDLVSSALVLSKSVHQQTLKAMLPSAEGDQGVNNRGSCCHALDSAGSV